MKVRYDFVTNSSSSSFVINKRHLDHDQILAIHNHIELGKKLKMYYSAFDFRWDIDENDEYIGAYTNQDNFSMSILLDTIGVNPNDVHWGFSIWDNNIPEYDIEEDWRKLLYEDS